MAATIDFHFDFLSPFAYLARHRLTQIADQFGCTIAWHPVDLAATKKAAGNTGPGNRDMPVKLAYFKTDLARWVKAYDLPFTWAGNYASRQMNIGALYARERGRAAEYVQRAFHAGWGSGHRLDDAQVLRDLAQSFGWDGGDFLTWIASPAGADAYAEETAAAIARGVFGVPTMLVDDQMWWGNDRLFMLAEYLRAHPETGEHQQRAGRAEPVSVRHACLQSKS
jgi:2-hydroxychromene-2-carboxylate isomerase